MLGIGGKFASSKGMVAVPDLSGLTRQQAKDAISSAGLRFGSETEISNSSGSSSDGKATNQSIAAGTLIDYESTISFQYFGTYVAPPPPVTLVRTESTTLVECIACGVYAGLTYSTSCSGGVCTTTKTRTYTDTVSNTPATIYFYSDGTSSIVATGPSTTSTSTWYGTVAQTTTGGKCTSNAQC